VGGRLAGSNPDRLLPVDPQERTVARRIFDEVRDEPIVSPHGHVDPTLLLDDEPFPDPATLFVTTDHYVTRLLHANGVPLEALGIGHMPLSESEARHAWRALCEHWHVLAGTAARTWLEVELAELFDVVMAPSAETADVLYDQIADRLDDDAYRPRRLYERFGISVLATTTDPCDDLRVYSALEEDQSWTGRVVPAFRPDRYLEAWSPTWPDAVRRLGETAGIDTSDYAGYVAAIEELRRRFVARGATSSDHAHVDVQTDPLEPADAVRIYRAARSGKVTEREAVALRHHMLFEMARMSCDDGLVMTLHGGVRRDHHRPTAKRFGSDTGHDIPLQAEFTDALRPLLERFGTEPGFHLVVFTVDESTWSRELAPMASFYPSLYMGVPWWFLDSPDAMRRFRAAVTETAGFTRTSGFVDDARAFCSISARHDTARRIDAGVLARLVCEHRLDETEAVDVARNLVTRQPLAVFKM
jgi:glucuronate isomerase